MHEQKISKLRDQMLGAKTNEQYRAFQHEIEYRRKGNPQGRGSHSGADVANPSRSTPTSRRPKPR